MNTTRISYSFILILLMSISACKVKHSISFGGGYDINRTYPNHLVVNPKPANPSSIILNDTGTYLSKFISSDSDQYLNSAYASSNLLTKEGEPSKEFFPSSNSNERQNEYQALFNEITPQKLQKSNAIINSKRFSDLYMYLFGLLTTALGWGLYSKRMDKLLKITRWAKANKHKSRIIIGAGHGLISVLGLASGSELAGMDLYFSDHFDKFWMALMALSFIHLFGKGISESWYNSLVFLKSKMAHFLTSLSLFMVMLCGGNKLAHHQEQSASLPNAIEQYTPQFSNQFINHYDDKTYTKSENRRPDGRGLLLVFYIALFLVATYILAGLCCAALCAELPMLFVFGVLSSIAILIVLYRILRNSYRSEYPIRKRK